MLLKTFFSVRNIKDSYFGASKKPITFPQKGQVIHILYLFVIHFPRKISVPKKLMWITFKIAVDFRF